MQANAKKMKFDKFCEASIPGFDITGEEWCLFVFTTILSGG